MVREPIAEETILTELAARLRARFAVREIRLFGSRARGDGRPDSDFDVLVVADSDEPFLERQRAGQRALGSRTYSLDLLILTPEEARREADKPGSVVYWAMREGRTL